MNQTEKLLEALEKIVNECTSNEVSISFIEHEAKQALESYKDGWISVEEVAQWVIDNRYPKSETDKLSDHELYHGLIDRIKSLPTPPQNKTI